MTRAKTVLLGPMSANSSHCQHFVEERLTFPTPVKVCNAMMPAGSLRLGANWNTPARPGADQHARYRSRGEGC